MKRFFKTKLVMTLIVLLMVTSAIIVALSGSVLHSHAASSGVTITEFPLPTIPTHTNGITTGPDGNLWFTECNSNKIGRITPSGIVTAEFALPPPPPYGRCPFGITAGPDGNLWFTQIGASEIGRITPSGVITLFPTINDSTSSIIAGPDSNLWFTDSGGIGRITPSGTITEFPTSSGPGSITAGPDGNLWFTEYYRNQIGKITVSGTITEFPIPTSSSDPSGIIAGPEGNLWFTEYYGNQIGKITVSGTITEFPLPTSNSYPEAITNGPDGNLWFTELFGKIGQITPSGNITEFPTPTPSSGLTAITTGPDGNLWFTENYVSQIGRINLPPKNLWGVDSYSHITPSFYDSVTTTFGTPDFWGRYIGNNPGFPNDMDLTEAPFVHYKHFAILPIYFNYTSSAVQGYDTGQGYALLAIKDAQQRLNISQSVGIFVDIEGGSSPDAAFIQGWYDKFNSTFPYVIKGQKYTYQAGYYKAGYYANTLTSSHFDAPFCAAVSQESAIGTNSFIWTPQPQPSGYVSANTIKASAPSYNPVAVSCPNQQIPIPTAWQYSIQNPNKVFPPNVDLDEAQPSLPLWYP